MIILGIDPGSELSAWVRWDSKAEEILDMMICHNDILLDELDKMGCSYDILAVEHMQNFMMRVGKEVFETCYWIGEIRREWRVNQAIWHNKWFPVNRKQVVTHICDNPRANDTDVRFALKERFGMPGTKQHKGKLYGVKKDLWSALAIAVYAGDMLNQ